ncbi:MAG: helix-turn-helix transcriptional regulator [Deltaproteobacteria bacterium]|nr:helix-turn-helix transcriptional regulator [Deltaproteobacteria bacterium]
MTPRLERAAAGALCAIAFVVGIDIYDDLTHGADLQHVGLELIALILTIGIIVAYGYSVASLVRRRHQFLSLSLNEAIKDRDEWRVRSRQYLQGLGRAIEQQFVSWGLSESERDIALLILKGFSHKEIANLRNTSERTVRQQAAAVYGKAKVENKAQLSAFFLEDLMLPGAMPTSEPTPEAGAEAAH